MEKKIVKIVAIFVTVSLKMTLYLSIYFIFTKKPILSQFKIDALNTMYVLSNLTGRL